MMGAFFLVTAGLASSELKVVIGALVLICAPGLALSPDQILAVTAIVCTYIVGRSVVKLWWAGEPPAPKKPDA